MVKKMFGFGIVALTAALGTQQAAATWQDKAADVLAKTRAAIGGARLAGLETFSADASVQRNVGTFQMNADLELLVALPDKYARSETSTGGMNVTATTGFNGDRSLMRPSASVGPRGGMMVIRMGPGGPLGGGEKLTAEQEEEANRRMVRSARHEISRLMLGWFGMTHPAVRATYTYAGEAESPDGSAHVIDVKDADGFSARLFIDQGTSLPLMLVYQGPKRVVMTNTQHAPAAEKARPSGGGAAPSPEADVRKRIEDLRNAPPAMVEYHLYFSDWSDMDGVRFPRKIQRAVEGTTEEEWAITKFRMNPKIDAGRFEVQG